MTSPANAAAKAALRARMRAVRSRLSPARRDHARTAIGEALVAFLEATPPEARAWLALFSPAATEAAPAGAGPALRAAGWKIAYPVVDGHGLVFAAVHDEGALSPGHRGILEPPPSAPRVAPSALAVVLVPGLAFDRAGGRLGQGGGHYDRTLAALPAASITIGVCFSSQIVPAVPRDVWDVPIDVVLTDEGVLVTANKPLPHLHGR